MIGEDKAAALAENVVQTSLSLSTSSTRPLAYNRQEVENEKTQTRTSSPQSSTPKRAFARLTAAIVVSRIRSTSVGIKPLRAMRKWEGKVL